MSIIYQIHIFRQRYQSWKHQQMITLVWIRLTNHRLRNCRYQTPLPSEVQPYVRKQECLVTNTKMHFLLPWKAEHLKIDFRPEFTDRLISYFSKPLTSFHVSLKTLSPFHAHHSPIKFPFESGQKTIHYRH